MIKILIKFIVPQDKSFLWLFELDNVIPLALWKKVILNVVYVHHYLKILILLFLKLTIRMFIIYNLIELIIKCIHLQ